MERNDWHLQDTREVLDALQTDMYKGLSHKEAARRHSRDGSNTIWYIKRTSVKETMIACLSDLATLLLVVAAVFAAIFEESRSALGIVVILLLGALLRTAAYCKAKGVLENNAAEAIPTCSVLRENGMCLLPAHKLVVGDIVFLEGGHMVPADGRIVAGDELAVAEKGITANRTTVKKFNTVIHTTVKGSEIPIECRSNMLYAGSTVLWGQARMVVTATGENALISRKQGGIRIAAGETLPLMEKLTGWCRVSSLVMLALVLVISTLSLLLGRHFAGVFLSSMVLAVSSMSEYLTAIAYIMMAVAMQDTGKRYRNGEKDKDTKHSGQKHAAVINDITSAQRIAALRRLVVSDIRMLKSGEMALHSWFTEGEIHSWEKEEPSAALGQLLEMTLATVGGQQLHTALSGSAITAMSEKYTMLHKAADMYTDRTKKALSWSFRVMDIVEGSRGMAAGMDTVLLQQGNDVSVAVSGEIQQVMGCCTTWLGEDGKSLPITDELRRKIFTEAAQLTLLGARVIACARRPSPYTTLNRLSLLQSHMCFTGFIAIAEPPAEGTAETIRKLREAQISLIVLSDTPEQDLYYGHALGLFDKNTKILRMDSGGSLPENENAIVEMPPVQTPSLDHNVNHSRLRYERLRLFLQGWSKEKGPEEKESCHTAVLVQNVLDTRLMTLGDVPVAVGESDTRPLSQPLKAKADVILYPKGGQGGLREMAETMIQSRRALFHIWCAAVYLSISQVSRMALLLFSVFLGYTMPPASSLLLVGLLSDFTAVLVMAFAHAPKDILALQDPYLGLPAGKKTVIGIAALGIFWGLCEGALLPLCTMLGIEYTGVLLASIVLAQLFFSGAVCRRESFFKSRFHVAYGLYAAGVAALTGVFLLSWPTVWYANFLVLVPALLLLLFWELCRTKILFRK